MISVASFININPDQRVGEKIRLNVVVVNDDHDVDDHDKDCLNPTISLPMLQQFNKGAYVFQQYSSHNHNIKGILLSGHFFQHVKSCVMDTLLPDIKIKCAVFAVDASDDLIGGCEKPLFKKIVAVKVMHEELSSVVDKTDQKQEHSDAQAAPLTIRNNEEREMQKTMEYVCVHRQISLLTRVFYIFLCVIMFGVPLFVHACREGVFYGEESVCYQRDNSIQDQYGVRGRVWFVPDQKNVKISICTINDGITDYLLLRCALHDLMHQDEQVSFIGND